MESKGDISGLNESFDRIDTTMDCDALGSEVEADAHHVVLIGEVLRYPVDL